MIALVATVMWLLFDFCGEVKLFAHKPKLGLVSQTSKLGFSYKSLSSCFLHLLFLASANSLTVLCSFKWLAFWQLL